MQKTWICTILGGGTPTYLISAENEKRAWELIEEALYKKYKRRFCLTKYDCGGLIEVPDWHSDEERIVDIHDLYSRNGIILRGTFKD